VEITSQSRLSEILKDLTIERSSRRDIVVRSADGKVAVYDLFKAERKGEVSQDPYIRPGDTVEVKRASRQVNLGGEVRRPGTYQLLEGEGIRELISYYGDGLGVSAKSDMVVLTRRATEEKPESESIVFDLGAKELPSIEDGDSIRVASREEYLPIVYVEGAVVIEGSPIGEGRKPYNLQRVLFRKGQSVMQVMKPLEGKLYSSADLQKSYIIRGQERIGIDLEKLLHSYTAADDIELQANDRIVIPYGVNYAYVTGFVARSVSVEITSQSRLSEILKDLTIERSSRRDIVVRSADGKLGVYDLFKAERKGEVSQDPYIRPGDTVEVKRASRQVNLGGEVRRPGTYQLLEGEGIRELISYYGDGLGVSAKSDMVVLTRRATEEKPESESVVFDLASEELPALLDGDSIRVASREEYLPIIYIEGAVSGDIVGISIRDQTVAQTNYAVLRIPYREGITVSTLLRPLKDKILASANMQQAFIIRKGQETQIMINLEKLLYGTDLSGDVVLRPEDKIVIPYGSMYVFVTGEVTKSSWVGITGLTRLQDAITPLFTRYSSIRDVKVKSADGYEKTFDLFKAERYGDLSQNPFLRPGDEIIISSLTNLVTIQGEIKRPGTYQLLPGEGLKELVSIYADGFTEKANTSRLTLLHYLSESSPVGEKMQFDYTKFPDMELRLYDVVTVPSLQELLPVAWFEGAVGLSSTGASPETSQRLPYTFVPGETVSQAALANRKLFSAVSDLASAYIIHTDGTKTAVDLAKFIYDYDLTNDFPLQTNDIIIVPFRQFFVTVSGAVQFPGRYPYIPNRTWEYYIGLAGGFDTDKNSGQKITIYDVKSQKVAIAGREIQPEDNIVAESNSFTYNMMKVSSIISTVLSFTVLIISLLGL
jgi:protein involved in polysaccharide export with SLBB domain